MSLAGFLNMTPYERQYFERSNHEWAPAVFTDKLGALAPWVPTRFDPNKRGLLANQRYGTRFSGSRLVFGLLRSGVPSPVEGGDFHWQLSVLEFC